MKKISFFFSRSLTENRKWRSCLIVFTFESFKDKSLLLINGNHDCLTNNIAVVDIAELQTLELLI